MPSRPLSHRTPLAPDQRPHPRPRRRTLKAAGAVAMSLAALLLLSTAANLMLEGGGKAHAAPCGEKVQIKEGSINVSRSGRTGPTIVLLSGLGTPAPALDFAPLIRELGGFQTVVVEGIGYGCSGMEARPRTVENITEELHEVISRLAIKTPYTLAAHSIGGFYTLYYANKYPREVSSVVGIDPTVPASKTTTGKMPAAPVAPARKYSWAHIPSTTGLVRWATALGYGEPAGGGFTQTERQKMRQLTSWTFGNQAVTDETLRVGENAAKLRDVRYADSLPVLDFLSQDSIDQNTDWLGAHQRQLAYVRHHELVVLKGGHYLHWTQSKAMAHTIRAFLGHGGTT
jgi:pimeloyl-ACP methyl ester carboxylesterase